MTSKAKHMARSRRSHQAKRQTFGNFERASYRRELKPTAKIPLMDRLRSVFGRDRESKGMVEEE